MQFNVNQGVVKMLELIDKSETLQKMAWAVIKFAGFTALITAIRWW